MRRAESSAERDSEHSEGVGPDAAGLAGRGDEVYVAPQRKLVWWRFRKHRLAVFGLIVLSLIYVGAAFCEFLAPRTQDAYDASYASAPPQGIHLGFGNDPLIYVNDYRKGIDKDTMERTYVVNEERKVPLGFFVRGDRYRLWGLVESDRHLFGPTDPSAPFYAFGADTQGRDLLSRVTYGSRISMSVGLIGVALALVLGVVLGGVSGYFGGMTDSMIQRGIEFVMSLPTLPLWLGLAAAVPPDWGPIRTYVAITVILSLVSWTALARVVRGYFLQVRGEDYVLAAELDGASKPRVIFRHMLPAFTSYIIASLTLSIPGVILAESALSFLGLGLQPPAVSWGVLLQDAQNIQALASAPWLLLPGVAIVIAVVTLNFVGDGLRDAADPYEN